MAEPEPPSYLNDDPNDLFRKFSEEAADCDRPIELFPLSPWGEGYKREPRDLLGAKRHYKSDLFGYQQRDFIWVDYQETMIAGHEHAFRGPFPRVVNPFNFSVMLGSGSVYGARVRKTAAHLLNTPEHPVLNFGKGGASFYWYSSNDPRAFSNEFDKHQIQPIRPVLDRLLKCVAHIFIEVMSCRTENSTAFEQVNPHARRVWTNDTHSELVDRGVMVENMVKQEERAIAIEDIEFANKEFLRYADDLLGHYYNKTVFWKYSDYHALKVREIRHLNLFEDAHL